MVVRWHNTGTNVSFSYIIGPLASFQTGILTGSDSSFHSNTPNQSLNEPNKLAFNHTFCHFAKQSQLWIINYLFKPCTLMFLTFWVAMPFSDFPHEFKLIHPSAKTRSQTCVNTWASYVIFCSDVTKHGWVAQINCELLCVLRQLRSGGGAHIRPRC